MTSTYWILYSVISILCLFVVNFTFVKGKSNNKVVPAVGPTSVQEVSVVQEGGTHSQLLHKVNIPAVLGVLIFGMFVATLNQTVMNVALPTIMSEFNVSTSTAQWLTTGFMLVNGIVIPISAYLIETYGFRKLFLASMILFVIGSLICGFSTTFASMMVGRVFQALGAGVLMPLGMNVFFTIFPPEKRGAAMGIMGIAMILAPAVGPTLAGWVVENYSWKYMFDGMFILGLLVVLMALKWFYVEKHLSKPKFDFLSILTSAVGFGCLLYGFSEAGSDGWGSATVIINILVGVISIGFFVVRQLKIDNPILEFRVFKYGMFTLTTIINATLTMALFAAMMLLPIYLQNIRGFTPMDSGLLILPGALIMGLMGPIAGKIFDKYGAKWLAIVGLTITALATYEFTKLTSESTYAFIITLYIIRSFGMSLIMMPIMTAGLNALPQKLNAHGTAMSNTMRQVAGSLGTALLVTVMTNRTTFHTANYANDVTMDNPMIADGVHQISNTLAASGQVPSQMADSLTQQLIGGEIAKQAMISGINDAFFVATAICIVTIILSFFIKNSRFTEEKTEVDEAAD